jgi:hypothetical protein
MATATQLTKSPPIVPGQPRLGDRLAALWGRARVGWAQRPPSQRRGILVAGLLLAALFLGLAWYGLGPDWRTL